MNREQRIQQSKRICQKITSKIGEISPMGLGNWDKTWTLVESTDLFLDFFMFPDGTWTVQDEDEFQQAKEDGLMDDGVARRARETLDEIIGKASPIKLPEVPISVSLAVALDGRPLPRRRVGGFNYHAPSNAIIITDYERVRKGNVVMVSYDTWSE